MVKISAVLALVLLLAAALLWLAGQWGWLKGHAPANLGVHGGRLKPPSTTPNSVSSQAGLFPDHPRRNHAAIEPFSLQGLSPEAAIYRLALLLRSSAGITLVEQGSNYLRAEAQTRWLHFVDDLEFWFNPAKDAIEVRSASRLGRHDLGTNRRRVEGLRAAYLQPAH